MNIARADVAAFLLSQVDDDPREALQHSPGLGRTRSRGDGMRRRRLGWVVAAAVLGLVLLAGAPGPGREAPGPPGAQIAHRGGLAQAPENSLEAIRSAATRGADGVELDIRRRADGVLVCAHDPEGAPGGPLLGDALDLALSHGLLVELDLKTGPFGDRALVREVLGEIGRRDARDRVWVSAFHPLAALFVRRTDPLTALGWPAPSTGSAGLDRLIPWGSVGAALGASVLEPASAVATDRRLRRWQAAGWRVEVYDVPPERVERLRDAGVSVVVDAVGGG